MKTIDGATLFINGKEIGSAMVVNGEKEELSFEDKPMDKYSYETTLKMSKEDHEAFIKDLERNSIQCLPIPVFHIANVISKTYNRGALKTIKRLIGEEVYNAIIKELEKQKSKTSCHNK